MRVSVMHTPTSRRTAGNRVRLVAVAAVLAFAVAGCAGGAGDEPGPGASNPALGPARPAAGDPVKIMFISQGVTQANDATNEIKGAEAAAAYANEHLGGLAGRPVELSVCEERGTPSGAQECGNRAVRDGVAAVVAGAPGFGDSWLPIVHDAGIPVGINASITRAALTTEGVFVFSNAVAPFGTPAAFAREQGITRTAMIVIDVPGATGPARQLAPDFFANAGSTLDVVTVPPGAPEMTAQIQAAENNDPQLYSLFGPPAFCSSALQAIRSLAIDAPVTMLDDCIDRSSGTSAPGGYAGLNIVAKAVTSGDDPEYQLFTAVLETYADDDIVVNRAVGGFQAMLSFVRGVNAGTSAAGSTDVSAPGIRTALETMPPAPFPLGGGATFSCDGSAIPVISPNLCTTAAFLAESSADGALSGFRTLDPVGIYDVRAR